MEGEQFCLRWNNFHSNVVSAFSSLLEESAFIDVTLSCEGRQLRAHKVVLSACSSYFRELLTDNPCQHPIIILRGIAYADLAAILAFIYHGEVNVSQERLQTLLHTAESLKIKGLAEESESSPKEDKDSPSPVTSPKPALSRVDHDEVPTKKPRISSPDRNSTPTPSSPTHPATNNVSSNDISENDIIEEEHLIPKHELDESLLEEDIIQVPASPEEAVPAFGYLTDAALVQSSQSGVGVSGGVTGQSSQSLSTSYHASQGSGPWQCSECGRRFNYKHNLGVHYRDHHTGCVVSFCHLCPYVSKTLSGLRMHLRRRHSAHQPLYHQANSWFTNPIT